MSSLHRSFTGNRRLLTLLIVLPFFISGCKSFEVLARPDNVHTSLGYINTGFRKPGDLFLWNREAGYISPLDGPSEYFPPPARPISGPDMDASDIRGLKIAAKSSTDAGVESFLAEFHEQIEANIQQRVKLVAVSAERISYGNSKNPLVAEIDRYPYKAEDWKLDEAISGSSYLYLLVTDVVYGDAAELFVDRQQQVGNTITMKFQRPGFFGKQDIDVTVHLIGQTDIRIKGDDTVLFINFTIFQPKYKTRPGITTYDFERVLPEQISEEDLSKIPELLRSIRG